MDIIEFARSKSIPVLNNNSSFPKYFATHVVNNESVLDQRYLLSANSLDHRHLTSNVDDLLGTTDLVFFALGKGYLTTKKCIGLIYNPFVLIKESGASLVMNDLLYVLEKTDLLHEFCLQHAPQINEVIKENINNLENAISGNLAMSGDYEQIFWECINKHQSLLIANPEDGNQYVTSLIFETMLQYLPENIKIDLKNDIKKLVVLPNTYNTNLDVRIKELFNTEKQLLNSFSDEITEERLIEIRVPQKHQLDKGLLGIYVGRMMKERNEGE
jgi:hypothetical protein